MDRVTRSVVVLLTLLLCRGVAADPTDLPSPDALSSAIETRSPEELRALFAPFGEAKSVGPEYREVLRTALKHADSRVRLCAAFGLWSSGQLDDEASALILDALAEPVHDYWRDDLVAYAALVARGDDALPLLKAALRHDSPRARAFALRAAAVLGPSAKELATDVVAADRRADEGLASLVAYAKWRLDGDDRDAIRRLVPLIEIERERKPGGAVDQLAKMGIGAREAIPALIAAMKTHGDRTVVEALDDLYPFFPERILPALKEALSDPRTADCAAAALQRREGPSELVLPHLVRMMNAEGNPIVERHYLAQMLALYGPKAASATPGLTRELRSPSGQVRIDSAIALGQIGQEAKDALPALRAALQDPDVAAAAEAAINRITTAR